MHIRTYNHIERIKFIIEITKKWYKKSNITELQKGSSGRTTVEVQDRITGSTTSKSMKNVKIIAM